MTFLVVASSHIIRQRRSCEASVIGRQLSQSTLMQVNFSSQTDKKSPSKWRTGRSFASDIKQTAQRTYQSSTRVDIARFGAFRPTICCIWMLIRGIWCPDEPPIIILRVWNSPMYAKTKPLTAIQTVAKVYKYLSLDHRKKISKVVEDSTLAWASYLPMSTLWAALAPTSSLDFRTSIFMLRRTRSRTQ